MDSLDFLADAQKGHVTVNIEASNGIFVINGVYQEYIEQHAPMLLHKLVVSNGTDASITFSKQESKVAVISLLRYIYMQDYRLSDQLFDQPCSILFHLQMFKTGQLYSIDALQEQARKHLFYELEYACSVSRPVIDLSNAIRFLYLELDSEDGLKEIIGCYCVQNLIYHQLTSCEAFCQTIYECPAFHQLLLKINMSQSFAAEGASQLMQMRVCPLAAHRSWNKEVQRAANFLCRMHTDDFNQHITEREPEPWCEPSRADSFVLVERPRIQRPTLVPYSDDDDEDTEDEDATPTSSQAPFPLPYRSFRQTQPSKRDVPLKFSIPRYVPESPDCNSTFAAPTRGHHRAPRRKPARPFANTYYIDPDSLVHPRNSPARRDAGRMWEQQTNPAYRVGVKNPYRDSMGEDEPIGEETPIDDDEPIGDSPTLEGQDSSSSDSEWALVEPHGYDENQGLLSAAVDPGRSGPLTVTNATSSDEESDGEWEVFPMEGERVTF